VLVAVGAAGGATMRWAVTEIVAHDVTSLLVVNTAGALLLGVLLARTGRGPGEATRLLVGVGFCGALTTFSSLAVDLAARLDDGRPAGALAVLVASLVLGVAAVRVGARLAGERP
jgi:CrcB protein